MKITSKSYQSKRPMEKRQNSTSDDEVNFKGEMPFLMIVKGSVNGKPFSIEGKGFGNATTGNIRGKWACPSGKLPISWAALAGTLGYGYKCFIKNQEDTLSHFYQDAMPDGYSQERIVRFQGDGNIKSYHEVYVQKGVVINKVTLQGDGFKAGSPVLNNGIDISLPSTETTFPFENGLKSLVHHLFPVKQTSGDYIVATQITVNRPLSSDKQIKIPGHHFTRGEIKQIVDNHDKSDHIIHEVVMECYGYKFLRRDKISEFDVISFDSKSCKKQNFDEVIEEVDQEFFRAFRRQKKSSGSLDGRIQY